ncbi:MAG: hypothetical protein H0X27_09155, partial [Caulobacteraceae bacterium]|nr:hypothetical protein [Caulobacteraceae bacterium]
MTTKRLRGTYTGGYTISAAYSLLKIDDTAVIKGVGIVGGAPVKVENHGVILSGKGGDGSASHVQGRDGNTGINLAGGNRVVNFGTVIAGQGGGGYSYRPGAYAGAGGAGGAAVVFSTSGSVTNRNVILGGDGGAGGARLASGGPAGVGGAGGAGILLIAGGDVIDSAQVTGGAGGIGGYGLQGGAAGGAGGAAIAFGA